MLRGLLVLPEPDHPRVQVDVAVGTEGHDPVGPHLLPNPGVFRQPLRLELSRLLVFLPPGGRLRRRVRVSSGQAASGFDEDRLRVVDVVEGPVSGVNLLLTVLEVVLLILNNFGRLRQMLILKLLQSLTSVSNDIIVS